MIGVFLLLSTLCVYIVHSSVLANQVRRASCSVSLVCVCVYVLSVSWCRCSNIGPIKRFS